MTVFDLQVDAHRLDFRLLRTSVVTLFWRSTLFAEATDWLRQQGYTIAALDASS